MVSIVPGRNVPRFLPSFLLACLLLQSSGFAGECVSRFRRGMANDDLSLDISDGKFVLVWLFLKGEAPACMDAADSNDSGRVDIADPVYLFQYLFTAGGRPPDPGPAECGLDPTEDDLGCELFRACDFAASCFEGCCPDGSFCQKEDGECGSVGSCSEIPRGCPRNFDPVCGCNGETYSNRCVAHSNGVSVLHRGPCGAPCRSNEDCDGDGLCVKSDADCDGEGVCREVPQFCPENIDPVCGCDGESYSNRCEAWAAGVSVAHEGECRNGCVSNADCDGDDFCSKQPGDCDGLGECEVRPEACLKIFDPVCGCDGNTYGNACKAAAAGVNVVSRGPCEVRCQTGDDCGDGFCVKRDGDCDGEGVCREVPQNCPDNVDPVCGCDGESYSNRCEASASGVSVAHEGECRDGCVSNADCDGDDFCSKQPGDCDGIGKCEVRREVCPAVFDPVCGCDGNTYGNACKAAAAGVNVVSRRPCVVLAGETED